MSYKNKKSSSIDALEIAADQGGKCLNWRDASGNSELWWQCERGHQWEASADFIAGGGWCPICTNTSPTEIKDVVLKALREGGLFLSGEYKGPNSILRWQCFEGHVWEASPDSIRQGGWCPVCKSKKKYSIEDMHEFAAERDGKCLSDEYLGSKVKLKWQCAEGHTWETKPGNIVAGHWCPKCAGVQKLTIEDLKNDAREKGGECLAEECLGSNARVKWRCSEGHTWATTPNMIRLGSWCPKCAGTAPLSLEEVQKDAEAKGGRCLSTAYERADKKLLWECAYGHQWTATASCIRTGHWCPACAGIPHLTIEDMQKEAGSHGGRCLSTEYINAMTKLLWECADGHRWEAAPYQIRQGHWCPSCARKPKWTIEDMQHEAQKHGGQCLSKEYVHNRSKLKWKCAKGHTWEAVPSSILTGYWCHKCATASCVTIDDMQRLAKDRGGKCLSNDYINSKTKLKWQCSEGHTWEAVPNNVKNGSWCPKCAIVSRIETRKATAH